MSNDLDACIEEGRDYLLAAEPGTDEYDRIAKTNIELRKIRLEELKFEHELDEVDRKYDEHKSEFWFGVGKVVTETIIAVGKFAFNRKDARWFALNSWAFESDFSYIATASKQCANLLKLKL